MRRILVVLLSICVSFVAFAQNPVKVDQVGYPASAQKIALVTSTNADSFTVKRIGDDKAVYSGKLGPEVADSDTGDKVRAADFSAVNIAGEYYIEVPGAGKSYKFQIAPDVYSRTYYMAMLGFYGLRCGTAVDLGPEFPDYKHGICHKNGEFHKASTGKEGPRPNLGGWHDAGDYGRYMTDSGIATGTMLWTYELYGAKLNKIALHIPEHGNGTPDILNEARWNIEWMLKMQDDDGGAWFKQATLRFGGFIDPDKETAAQFVLGTGAPAYKSTCATANLSAVAAIAARLYKPFDAKFAETNLVAAKKAFDWAVKNPNVLFRNTPEMQSGEYRDSECGDDTLWAAAELWRTTGDAAYNQYFVEHYKPFRVKIMPRKLSWEEASEQAYFTYAMTKRAGADDAALKDTKSAVVETGRKVVAQTRNNPYMQSLVTADYTWGSNGNLGELSKQLLMANALEPDPSFVAASLDNLHYLLGRNTFAISWVTQLGENAYKHPHHRPSNVAGKLPWPGLLSGGPNKDREDGMLRKLPADTPAAKLYIDEVGSYASNEVAINWQAALVFTLAGNLP